MTKSDMVFGPCSLTSQGQHQHSSKPKTLNPKSPKLFLGSVFGLPEFDLLKHSFLRPVEV